MSAAGRLRRARKLTFVPHTSLHKGKAGGEVFEVGQQKVNLSNHVAPRLDLSAAYPQ